MIKLVFIHIGKTAGTSLRKALEDAWGRGACSDPFIQKRMTQADADYYETFRAICGHISRDDQHRWFPDRAIVTILREPIDRGLSFLHYVKSLPPESSRIAADAQRMSQLELIETEEAQRNLNNTMVRQLGGHMLDPPTDLPALFETAKLTLRSALWVGRQDRMEADLARLGDTLGTRIAMRRENTTPNRPFFRLEDPAVVDRLNALSEWDQRLWEWACRRT